MRAFIIPILFFSLLTLTNCTKQESKWPEREATVKKLDQELKDLAAEIKTLYGEGACKEDLDCHLIGLGAKTCGGYRDFLIYSTRDTKEGPLLMKVQQFNEKSDKITDMLMTPTKCGVKPGEVKCIEEFCRAVSFEKDRN